MKRITTLLIVCCLGLLFAASTCSAQMYTINDLGTLGGSDSYAIAINNVGQVVGESGRSVSYTVRDAFRTSPNKPIDPATDDIGNNIQANGVNDSGQAVGRFCIATCHAFRTAPNAPFNRTTDLLDVSISQGFEWYSEALAINNSGQVTGYAYPNAVFLGFRTAPNLPINAATDSIGIAGRAINSSGQAVGCMCENGAHAARTDPNGPIPPATYDLGTLGGTYSWANDINDVGQVVGYSVTPGDTSVHAFRTAPNMPINPATDDLGPDIQAISIDDFGQVIGSSFGLGLWLYSNGGWHDLNNDNLVPAASTCYGFAAVDINNVGQIAANASCSGQQHAVRLDPIYKGFVQQPINADGSSVFKANRGVIPVKFAVTQYNSPSCALPATIGITRISGGTLGAVDQSTYSTQADNGSNFRIDGCQYIYNLAASSLGVGTYRVDISINGIFVGHAVFALE